MISTNGHLPTEPDEPEQSVLTWAELFAEPAKPRRKQRPRPASMSMFEWTVEKEREAQTVS